LHADSTEGKELVEYYKISGLPTIIIVDKDSIEIDRIIGYLPPENFLDELQRIQRGENTIADLINRTANNPEDFGLGMTLASKYEDRGDLKSALEVWESVAVTNIGDKAFVIYKLVELRAHINNEVEGLEYFIADNINSEYAQEAFKNIISIFRQNHDLNAEVDAWRRYVNLMELKKQYTPSFYNSFAWRMGELEQNLDRALEKIRTGIQMVAKNDSSTLAGYMDTEAEVLWKMGNIEEAVEVIEKCIALQPHDKYFNDQRTKFLE
jgi:tetratricopeptide (TPR) repeat protein